MVSYETMVIVIIILILMMITKMIMLMIIIIVRIMIFKDYNEDKVDKIKDSDHFR